MGKGQPRLDKYKSLIARSYEALILLLIKQKVQGLHVFTNHGTNSLIGSRRRLTKNLAFVCDRKKGGDSTASVVIEDCEDCFKFWVALNAKKETMNLDIRLSLTEFLREVLTILQRISKQPMLSENQRSTEEDQLARKCATFADKRLKSEVHILRNSVRVCLEYLETSSDNHGLSGGEMSKLKSWMVQFGFNGLECKYEMCLIAYKARHDAPMKILEQLAQESNSIMLPEGISPAFETAKHFIGRLADHIRVPKQLIEDAVRRKDLLDTIQVDVIEAPICVPPPEVDSHTTLDGILRRMSNSKNVNQPALKQWLQSLQNHINIETRIMEEYAKMHKNPPIVHSEIQGLEHFHRNKLRYADGDKFVGTSKPSCFCCKLYFRHHPSRPVEPESHEEAYRNWGPILVPEGVNDPLYMEQRDILNLVNQDVRAALAENIPNFHHPNSVTGITQSIDGHGILDHGELTKEVVGHSDTHDNQESDLDCDDGGVLL